MKVSITFDKSVDENKKKEWTKEIKTVVDRIRRPDIKISPKYAD